MVASHGQTRTLSGTQDFPICGSEQLVTGRRGQAACASFIGRSRDWDRSDTTAKAVDHRSIIMGAGGYYSRVAPPFARLSKA